MSSTKALLADNECRFSQSLGTESPTARQPNLVLTPPKKLHGRRPLRNAYEVDIANLVPDPEQPRKTFDEESLNRLARSIQEEGQLTPILVRWNENLGKNVIINGERRYQAAKRAGLITLACVFDNSDLDQTRLLTKQLIENIHREDLPPVEEALAFRTLMDLNGWNGKELANALNLAESTVYDTLALLKLSKDIQDRVNRREISLSAAVQLTKLKNPETQADLARKIVDDNLTYQQIKSAVRQRQGKANPKKQKTKAPRRRAEMVCTPTGQKVKVTGIRDGSPEEIRDALQDALASYEQLAPPADTEAVSVRDFHAHPIDIGAVQQYSVSNGIRLQLVSSKEASGQDLEDALAAALHFVRSKNRLITDPKLPWPSSEIWR